MLLNSGVEGGTVDYKDVVYKHFFGARSRSALGDWGLQHRKPDPLQEGPSEMLGEEQEALSLYLRALEIREKVLGPKHFYVATTLDSIANLQDRMGQVAEALDFACRSLSIWERFFGPEHSHVAKILYNLAGRRDFVGDLAGSLDFYQRALSIFQRVNARSEVADALDGIADLKWRSGETDEAILLYNRELSIREELLGVEHPEVPARMTGTAAESRPNRSRPQARGSILLAAALSLVALRFSHGWWSSSFVSAPGRLPTEAAALSTAEDQNQTILHLELDEPRNKGSRLLQDLDGWQMMPLGVPKASYRIPGAPNAEWVDIYNRLYRERIIFIGKEIDDKLANEVIGVLHIKSPVITINVGLAASMASFLLAAGEKGKRIALPHSRTMIHQAMGGAQGQAEDIKVEAQQIVQIHENIVRMYSKVTGKDEATISKDLMRDNFMSAEEAKEYGLIDQVIQLADTSDLKAVADKVSSEAPKESAAPPSPPPEVPERTPDGDED
eukprot:g22764.t1